MPGCVALSPSRAPRSSSSGWRNGPRRRPKRPRTPSYSPPARAISLYALRRASLAEEFRRWHPRADPLELFDGHAVEAALAAGVLDGPDHHSSDERRNPLHARGGSIVPRERCRTFGAVLDRRWSGDGGRAVEGEERGPRELAGRVGTEGIFRHEIAGHRVGPGAAAAAVGVHLARPASPPERAAASNVNEQLR